MKRYSSSVYPRRKLRIGFGLSPSATSPRLALPAKKKGGVWRMKFPESPSLHASYRLRNDLGPPGRVAAVLRACRTWELNPAGRNACRHAKRLNSNRNWHHSRVTCSLTSGVRLWNFHPSANEFQLTARTTAFRRKKRCRTNSPSASTTGIQVPTSGTTGFPSIVMAPET